MIQGTPAFAGVTNWRAKLTMHIAATQSFLKRGSNDMAFLRSCIPAIAFAALLSPAANAADTSFDCSKATQKIEKLVCGDDQLASLDRTLADDFGKAMGQITADDQKDLRMTQAAWIKSRNACGDESDPKACALQS